MSLRCTVDWSSALRDMRERSTVSPFITAAGKFDLRAIMQAAIAEARPPGRGVTGHALSWRARMGIALKLIWSKARRALATLRPSTVLRPEEDRMALALT